MPATPILVLLLVAALWVALGFGLARFGGWSTLATYYRGALPDHGLHWHFISARLGPVGYRQCLMLGADSRGLRLSMLLPLPFSHPALFIPWAEIDKLAPCRHALQPMVRLQVRRAPSIAIDLPRQLAIDVLRQAYGRTLPPGADALLAADARTSATAPRTLEST